jgi:hypothetical protein
MFSKPNIENKNLPRFFFYEKVIYDYTFAILNIFFRLENVGEGGARLVQSPLERSYPRLSSPNFRESL